MLGMIKPLTTENFNYQVRRSAFRAWVRANPDDPELTERLIGLVQDGSYDLRNFSIELLGKIRSDRASGILRSEIAQSGDADLRAAAMEALEKINFGRDDNTD
jgi:HEAT repeat protein